MTQETFLSIEYRLTPQDGGEELFLVRIDAGTMEMQGEDPPEDLPEWTMLPLYRCQGCPLPGEQFRHCPAAANIAAIVRRCERILSCDRVLLQVTTQERIVRQDTTAQKALSSLLGLLIATSACPRTAFFKPMARFHLPLASEEETVFRATSAYLLCQYFVNKAGGKPDLDLKGLEEIYRGMQEVNMAMARRLRAAAKGDSSINALVLLDMYAKAMPYFLNKSLHDLRPLFAPFLKNFLPPATDGLAAGSENQNAVPRPEQEKA